MNRITFKQFIMSYNFRYNNGLDAEHNQDTSIIRVYYPDKNVTTHFKWFEFGIEDYDSDDYKLNAIQRIFSDFVSNLYVDFISYNDQYEKVVTVYLTEGKKLEVEDG